MQPLPSGLAATPALAAASAAVRLCDVLAAHPDDPEAFAAGVADAKLDAKAAIAACEQAVKAEPQTPRLHFQLARGYLKADRFENATEQLIAAAILKEFEDKTAEFEKAEQDEAAMALRQAGTLPQVG